MTDMKNFLAKVSAALAPLGFRKSGNKTYRRLRDGVYHFVHIQPGAYGNYFFINIGVNPEGFPNLVPMNPLKPPKNPGIDDCAIRVRINEVVGLAHYRDLIPDDVYVGNTQQEDAIISMLTRDLLPWLERIGALRYIAKASVDELWRMMPFAPIGQPAFAWLLKVYSDIKLGNLSAARMSYEEFYSSRSVELDFTSIEKFFGELLVE